MDAADRWKPPSVEFGFRGSWLGYAGGDGGGIGFILDSIDPPGEQIVIALGNSMHNGWNLGGSVTLDSQKYFSQEFSYNYSFSTFQMGLAGWIMIPRALPCTAHLLLTTPVSGLLRLSYNLLIHIAPKDLAVASLFRGRAGSATHAFGRGPDQKGAQLL